MSRRFITFISVLALLGLTACQAGNGDTPRETRAFGTPEGKVDSKGPVLKAQNVGESQMAALLHCDKPSLSKRLDKEKFNTTVERTTRSQRDYNEPVKVDVTRTGFSTANEGKTYIRSFEHAMSTYGSFSALPQGPYAWSQNCTDTLGCVENEDRVFTKNDLIYMLGHSDREYRARWQADNKTKGGVDLSCRFVEDVDAEKIDDSVREITFTIHGSTYPAVEIVHQRNGKMECNQNMVGKGMTVEKTIIIADLLPNADDEAVRDFGNCTRTRVYNSETVYWGNETVSTTESEITNYTINGEVQSVEEYEASLEDYAATVANLEDAVRIAQRRFSEATTAFAEAQATTQAKDTDYQAAQGVLEKAEDDLAALQATGTATPAEIQAAQTAVTNAERQEKRALGIFESAKEAQRLARDSKDKAELAYGQAQRELENYKENNRPD